MLTSTLQHAPSVTKLLSSTKVFTQVFGCCRSVLSKEKEQCNFLFLFLSTNEKPNQQCVGPPCNISWLFFLPSSLALSPTPPCFYLSHKSLKTHVANIYFQVLKKFSKLLKQLGTEVYSQFYPDRSKLNSFWELERISFINV